MGFKRAVRAVCAAVIVFFSLGCIADAAGAVIGTVPYLLIATGDKNALYQQCSLGDAAADAVRQYLNADIAVVNGGDLIGNLPPGDITQADLDESIRAERRLAVAEVSGEELFQILESALSHVVVNDRREYNAEASENGAFPHVSGIRVSYNPAGQPGGRISRLVYNDKPVQPDDRFTLAATIYMFSGGYDLPAVTEYQESEKTLRSVMADYVHDGMEDYSISHVRVYPMEIHTPQTLNRYAIFTGVVICAVLFILLIPPRKLKRVPKVIEEESEDSK